MHLVHVETIQYAGRINTLPRPDYSVSISQSTGKSQFSRDNPKSEKIKRACFQFRTQTDTTGFFTFQNFFSEFTNIDNIEAEKITGTSC
jgi:hypothetical protein